MTRAYIGLGSNQGDPKENIKQALHILHNSKDIKITHVSSLYLTEPVGYEDQPWFYNCVAEVSTSLDPFELLKALQRIENALGRVRTIRWGPRTVDLDLLLYDNKAINTPELEIPHPRMKERSFVMVPLAEIAGKQYLPDGNKIEDVAKQINDGKKYSYIQEKLW